MNTFTKVLLSVPFLIGTVACSAKVDPDCVKEANSYGMSGEQVNKLCSTDPIVKATAQAEMVGGRVKVAPRQLTGLTTFRSRCYVEKGEPVIITSGTYVADGCFVQPF